MVTLTGRRFEQEDELELLPSGRRVRSSNTTSKKRTSRKREVLLHEAMPWCACAGTGAPPLSGPKPTDLMWARLGRTASPSPRGTSAACARASNRRVVEARRLHGVAADVETERAHVERAQRLAARGAAGGSRPRGPLDAVRSRRWRARL